MGGIAAESGAVDAVGLVGAGLTAHGALGGVGGDALVAEVSGEFAAPFAQSRRTDIQPDTLLADCHSVATMERTYAAWTKGAKPEDVELIKQAMARRPTPYDGDDDKDRRHRRRYRHK